MFRGNLEQRFDAELVELHRRFTRFAHVDLVDDGDRRFPVRAELRDDFEVARHDALLTIQDQHQEIRVSDGLLAFLDHELMERVLGGAEHPARVEEAELHPAPARRLLDHISRRAWHRGDDRAAR